MTGPEHYQAAEKCLAEADKNAHLPDLSRARREQAQVHATLALTMATALAHTTPSDESNWRRAQREA
jgi:hypothetical protein